MSDTPVQRTGAARRWLARLAFVVAAAAYLVPLAAAGLAGSILLIAVGLAGVAVALVAAWWFLTRRHLLRW